MQQIEAAVAIGFSHAQIDPQVEALDDAAGVELPGLVIVHQQILVVAQRADELFHSRPTGWAWLARSPSAST